MKNMIWIFLSWFTLSLPLLANPEAEKAAKDHLGCLIMADLPKLGESYAEMVLLMPGHDFMPKHMRPQGPGPRMAVPVPKAALMQGYQEKFARRPPVPPERRDEFMKMLRFKTLPTVPGPHVIQADRQGELFNFPIEAGDSLIEVTAEGRGESQYLHLRKIEGSWKVVSERLE